MCNSVIPALLFFQDGAYKLTTDVNHMAVHLVLEGCLEYQDFDESQSLTPTEELTEDGDWNSEPFLLTGNCQAQYLCVMRTAGSVLGSSHEIPKEITHVMLYLFYDVFAATREEGEESDEVRRDGIWLTLASILGCLS